MPSQGCLELLGKIACKRSNDSSQAQFKFIKENSGLADAKIATSSAWQAMACCKPWRLGAKHENKGLGFVVGWVVVTDESF
jgi:hypothetical protein